MSGYQYCDSCGDTYQQSDITKRWDGGYDTGAWTIVPGRTGNCLKWNPGGSPSLLYKNFTANIGTSIMGFAHYCTQLGSPSGVMGGTLDNGTFQYTLWQRSDGGVEIWYGWPRTTPNSGFIAQSPPGLVNINSWNYLEVYNIYSNSNTGTVIVRVNKVPVINQTGIRSAASGNNFANQLYIIGGNQNNSVEYFDDIYLIDTAGAVANNFLGDVGIYVQPMASNGTVVQFTPNGAATNAACINSATPTYTTYNSSSTVSNADMFRLGSVPTGILNPNFVQQIYVAETAVSGARQLEGIVCDSIGTPYLNGINMPIASGSYQWYFAGMDVNPVTGLAWTTTDLASDQSGYQIQL